MLLVNEFNRVVQIDDENQANDYLRRGIMKRADEDQVAELQSRRKISELEASASTSSHSVFYQTIQRASDGYGMSRDLLKGSLMKHDVFLSENYRQQKVGLLYNYPYSITQMRTDVRLLFTMFESDKIPDEWLDDLDAADEVIVPTKFCADVFAKAGIKTTIVPLGYDASNFKYFDRKIPVESNEEFVFIHYDSFNIRKGFLEVVQAFNEEFKNTEKAKLILKTVQHATSLPFIKSEYPNIEVVRGEFTERDLSDLLARAHCMVYPSRGEGFGITPLEAMATGIPAIVPNAHGISEYFNSQYMIEVKSDARIPAIYNRFKNEDVGNMVVCDVKDLRKKMRYAFNNQKKMHEMGRAASQYVKRYTYESTARQLSEIIKKWENAEVKKRAESKILEVERV